MCVMKRCFWYDHTVCIVCRSASPDICAWVVLIIGISNSKVVLQRQCNVILTLGMLASGRLDRGHFVARFVQRQQCLYVHLFCLEGMQHMTLLTEADTPGCFLILD